MEVQITSENFEKEVLNYEGIAILDFYGTWCMPCKMLAPVLDKIANEHNIKLAKVDVDENEELIRKYKIMSVPTIKIFKNGEEIGMFVGVVSESKILDLIQ
ncbi:MAG: thioredoxin [Clostridiales bacterium]|nr:thioredoxin [Clostridiales bacterium]